MAHQQGLGGVRLFAASIGCERRPKAVTPPTHCRCQSANGRPSLSTSTVHGSWRRWGGYHLARRPSTDRRVIL